MATTVVIPPTGEKESQGTIGMWFKREGDAVQKGDALCTVETEKASVEIEAPCSGVLKRVLRLRDEEVAVGDCIAIIGSVDEDVARVAEQVRNARTNHAT